MTWDAEAARKADELADGLGGEQEDGVGWFRLVWCEPHKRVVLMVKPGKEDYIFWAEQKGLLDRSGFLAPTRENLEERLKWLKK